MRNRIFIPYVTINKLYNAEEGAYEDIKRKLKNWLNLRFVSLNATKDVGETSIEELKCLIGQTQ